MDERDIQLRTRKYAVQAIYLFREIEKDSVGRIIGKQYLRSATSIGANMREADAAQSKKDFITKVSIAHKEAEESCYWLELMQDTGLGEKEKTKKLLDESDQIARILSKILQNSKKQ